MLKTNSKKARDNVRKFILANTTTYYGDTFESVYKACKYLWDTFKQEYYDGVKRKTINSREYLFNEWVQGLPTGHLFDYYLSIGAYNAITLLGNILEETEEERNKYSDDDACTLLTHLIYREIEREVFNI